MRQPQAQLAARLKSISHVIGLAVLAAGVLVLGGWAFDIEALKSVLPGLAVMTPGTAVGFMLAGSALWLANGGETERRRRLLALGCAVFVILLGLLTLGEYVFTQDFGIDRLFFSAVETPRASFPGRMSFVTAFEFTFIGIALLLLAGRPPLHYLREALALLAGSIALLTLVGYLFGFESLYSLGAFSSIALHTAFNFALLAAGILCAHPQKGLMKLVTADTIGGEVVRRFLPMALALPLALAGLGLWGERLGFYGVNFRFALILISTILLLSLVIWLNAGQLERIDVEHRRMAGELRERDRYRVAMLESALDCVVMIDQEGCIIEFNPAAEQTFGYTRAEAVGKEMAELLVPPSLRERHRAALARQVATGESTILGERIELTGMRADGEEFPVEVSILRIEGADPPVFSGFLRDITERKQAVEELRHSEERFRLLVDHAPNAIVIVNQKGGIVLVNEQVEKDFGYTREELTGESVERLVPQRFRAKHADYRAGFHAQPEARAMGEGRDLYGLRKDGSEFPVEIGLSPVEMQGDKLVMATIIDITKRKQAEDELQHAIGELQRSNTELEQFAYVASHDLQEPLRMVTSYMGLLEKRYKADLNEDAQEFIYYAVDGATRMQRLIQDLLAFSRVGTRGKALEPVDSNEALAGALKNLEIAIEETQADVRSGKLPPVMADKDQLVQVFQNLIGNAIKFSGGKTPKIKIDAALEDNLARFTVRDNGIGFDQQHAERMFVIFQRLNSRADYEGTGVGLAICKKVIERHGGSIWAESRPGKGATFFFTLRLAPEIPETEIKETTPEEETIKERAERLI